MNPNPFPQARQVARMALLGAALAALGACSTVPGLDSPNGLSPQGTATRYDYSTTIALTQADTQSDILKLYPGKLTAWHPEMGFAVLGQSVSQATNLVVGGKVLDKKANKNSNRTSEAAGYGVWSGGYGAWSGGYGAWSGGYGAWSGGYGAWSGGTSTTTASNPNTAIFNQIRLGQAEAYAPSAGAGVKIAVMDTGLDLGHPAFSGHLAPQNEWWDFVDNDATPQEGYVSGASNAAFGHGTIVAGIIGQIAPNVTILPIRVLDQEGYGDTTNIVSAIEWAVNRGAKVINLSLGSTSDDNALNNEIKWAYTRGVIVVASSGNTGDRNVTYPAANGTATNSLGAGLVGVGSVSTGSLDVKSSFSTYGTNLEMVAPGEKVFSAYPNNQVAWATGTSFAAPLVTGSFALALGQSLPTNMGTNNLATALVSSADSVNLRNPSLSGLLGSGRLNLETFMKKALGLI